jgi:hypothetical protein
MLAGESIDLQITLLDRFENAITPEAGYLEMKGGTWTTTMTVSPMNKGGTIQR